MKWTKWMQTMDLKFETHPIGPTMGTVLYQKWYRVREEHDGRTSKQTQWRPVRGQTGAHGLLKGIEDDEETNTCEPARDQA